MGMKCCKAKCWKIGLLVVAGIAALGLVVMALWNWLMPALFAGANEINYLQALGLLVLSKILFGGFRGRGCHGRWHRHRLENMTPEEREKFQAGMRGCCGGRNRNEMNDTPKE
jgi:hypothetical protein